MHLTNAFTKPRDSCTLPSLSLTAHPANVNMTKKINVHLHGENEVESRELRCGIQPGALMGKYSVQWKMISSSTDSFTVLSISQFNHSVNVSLDMNGVSCQCDVTIDHDGQNTITYNGGNFKFHVTKGQLYSLIQATTIYFFS